MLAIQRLCKSFYDPGRGEVRAVDQIDLHCPEGVVALVGANGAGKSTLLRLIATLLQPDAGSIRFGTIDVLAEPERMRACMGYLATGTRLYPRLTAGEALDYTAGFFGLTGEQLGRRRAEMIEIFGLHEFIDQRCEGLSTGQAQRVKLARTLLPDPDLLVLDEPTTGLDIVAARQVIEAVQIARRHGRLTVLATHVLGEVEELADHLLIIDRGRLAFDGAPAELGTGAHFAAAVHRLISDPAGETAEPA